MRLRGRLFRRSEAVPDTASTAILIAVPGSVKCLMSYIRVGAAEAGDGDRHAAKRMTRPQEEDRQTWARPPSAVIFSPVMYDDASDASNRTVCAISLASPHRPIGSIDAV